MERAAPRGALTFCPVSHQLKATKLKQGESPGGKYPEIVLLSPSALLPGFPVDQTHLKPEGKEAS